MTLIDAYGHVSLPRFISAEEFLRAMDETGVELAVLATAETCPDLGELSRAAVQYGDRLRVVGLPLGETPQEIQDVVAAQMDAGFAGIRLPDTLIAAQPAVLDIIGQAGGIPYIVGSNGLWAAAAALCDYLDRYPDGIVCAPHFAGVASPDLLETDEQVRRLFSHPRFLVIFSRHGAFPAPVLLPWAAALVEHLGWERILWGSEFPVALWRNESYRSTAEWIDGTPFAPSAAARERYLGGNARQLIVNRPLPSARPLAARWQRRELTRQAPVWLFPHDTLDLPEEAHRKLLQAYLAQAAPRGHYAEFVSRVLAHAADTLGSSPDNHS